MMFCGTPRDLEPSMLTRQHSGIGDAYSVVQSTHSITTVSRYHDHDEPEVNYDEGPTELYRRIEDKDWEGAIARLDSHPFEAKTWVSRKEQGSNKIRWRLLPLHATCIFRAPLVLIEALIEVYRDGPQMKDDQGMLPVHLACRNGGSKGVILALLKGFPESTKVKDKKGRSPLQLVLNSESQNAEAVSVAIKNFEKSIANGVRMVNMTPNDDTPQLMQEVDYENRTVLFRLLLKKDWNGAIKRAGTHPEEAATWIVTKGFNGSLRFLPLHKACVLAPPGEVIETLLNAYPEGSKCRDQDGWLPIHCACFYGACSHAIKTLLDANPKGSQLKDDEGRLPLHYACLKSASQNVVDILLENFSRGAMTKDDEGRLPIHHACSKGAPKGVIDALLKVSPRGAQSKDDQGRLPLHHACRKTSPEQIVQLLLRIYPRATQIKDDQDKLPIHYACSNGSSPEVVDALLAAFPESINARSGFGYTPLEEATAVNNDRTEPLTHVLRKFKQEFEKIKKESGKTSMMEKKLDDMDKRMEKLEIMLGQCVNLGYEIKSGVSKVRDPHVLIERMADRLIALDAVMTGSGDASTQATPQQDISPLGNGRSRSRGPFRRRK